MLDNLTHSVKKNKNSTIQVGSRPASDLSLAAGYAVEVLLLSFSLRQSTKHQTCGTV
jgi:hypothetical protein